MNTTLKQQTAAVKKIYQRAVLASQPDKYCKELNDACSTLAAVAMIGEHRIKLLPQLIEAAKNCAQEFDDDNTSYHAFTKLNDILNKLK